MRLLGRGALPPSHQLAGMAAVPTTQRGTMLPRHVLSDFQEARHGRKLGPWSKMDIEDLRASLDFGNTYADAASMLCRDEDEVRQKAKELGLVERPKRW